MGAKFAIFQSLKQCWPRCAAARFQACIAIGLLVVIWLGGVAVGQLEVLPSAVPLKDPKADRAPAPPDAAQTPKTEAVGRGYVPKLEDVRPSSFGKITPGVSTAAELESAYGKPTGERQEGEDTVRTYRIGPFSRVEFSVQDDLVVSVVVNLPNPAPLADIENELGLREFTPVKLRNEKGEPLGVVYPERGVMLTLDNSAKTDTVLQLVLETISAEPFLRRAEFDDTQSWEKQLEDLNFAVTLDPTCGDAYWRKAEIQLAAGLFGDSLASIDRARKLDPDAALYRLTRASVLASLGRNREASDELQPLFKEQDTAGYAKACAYNEVATLLASPPQFDYTQALKQRLSAVQFITPLAAEERVAVRRRARLLLVRTYLDIACDISAGDWRDKPAAMSKWLSGAKEICDAMIQQDAARDDLRFLVMRETIAANANIDNVPKDLGLDEAIALGERLAEKSTDNLFKRSVRRDLAKLLFDGTRVALSRGDANQAREFAIRSATLCDEVYIPSELSPRQQAWMGRLFFYLGSACAVHDDNHREAVRWYERALPLLNRTAPTGSGRSRGEHGERLVSMGVSYWGAGSRNEAIRLTKEGLDSMLESHGAGQLDRKALAVPYSNLAAMYKLVGKLDESRKMSTLSTKMESSEKPERE